MLDIIIRGGDVVTPQGVVQGDVAIAGETIAAVTSPGALLAQTATREIDAAGRIVMPGGIHPHVHLHHVWIKPTGPARDCGTRAGQAARRCLAAPPR
jgi:dihydropyrimidinase